AEWHMAGNCSQLVRIRGMAAGGAVWTVFVRRALDPYSALAAVVSRGRPYWAVLEPGSPPIHRISLRRLRLRPDGERQRRMPGIRGRVRLRMAFRSKSNPRKRPASLRRPARISDRECGPCDPFVFVAHCPFWDRRAVESHVNVVPTGTPFSTRGWTMECIF